LSGEVGQVCNLKDNVAVFQTLSGRRTELMIEADLRELNAIALKYGESRATQK
jgi:hypothetical protein